MGTIETTFDRPKELTIFSANGILTADDFREFLASYYEGEVTPFVLWDLTRADLSALKTRHIKEIAQSIFRISEVRRGGKTAFVYDKSVEYGIGRMFQAYTQLEELSFEALSFKSIDEAKAWLGV